MIIPPNFENFKSSMIVEIAKCKDYSELNIAFEKILNKTKKFLDEADI